MNKLQSLVEYIDPSDTLLLEWAGVKETSYREAEDSKDAEEKLRHV